MYADNTVAALLVGKDDDVVAGGIISFAIVYVWKLLGSDEDCVESVGVVAVVDGEGCIGK